MRRDAWGVALFGVGLMAAWLGIGSVGSALAQQAPAGEVPPVERGNMVIFRGGAAFLTEDRSNQVFTDTFGVGRVRNDSQNGYYVGAALELLLSKGCWGLTDRNVWAVGEIGIELKNFGSRTVPLVVPTAAQAIGVSNPSTNGNARLTMFTVDIGAKFKYKRTPLSKVQPWIMPAALDIHVISPPSNAGTVMDLGYQIAAGVEYEFIEGFKVGVDGRFHLAGNLTNAGTPNDSSNHFGTVGAYIGISF